MSIGARLREARKATKLSQAEFAERCGVSRNGQINFEKDVNQPGAAYLLALESLGIDAGYVLTGKPSATDPAEQRLLHAYRAADEVVQQMALQVLGVAVVGDAGKIANNASKIKVGTQTTGDVHINKMKF